MLNRSQKMRRWPRPLLTLAVLLIFALTGCAAQFVTRTSVDRSLAKEETIQRVAVLAFESPPGDLQAGTHISKLFEMNLLRTGLYRIAERGEIEKVFKERGFGLTQPSDKEALRKLGELLQVDAIVFGSVSHYNRFNLGFTARLVSIRSGLILWSVAQTGGRIIRPLSQVADETVWAAVEELQAKMR